MQAADHEVLSQARTLARSRRNLLARDRGQNLGFIATPGRFVVQLQQPRSDRRLVVRRLRRRRSARKTDVRRARPHPPPVLPLRHHRGRNRKVRPAVRRTSRHRRRTAARASHLSPARADRRPPRPSRARAPHRRRQARHQHASKFVDGTRRPDFDEAASVLRQTYGPRFQLFIIGAGMVSKYLAEMAQMLDYAVTVCDPREKLVADFAVHGHAHGHRHARRRREGLRQRRGLGDRRADARSAHRRHGSDAGAEDTGVLRRRHGFRQKRPPAAASACSISTSPTPNSRACVHRSDCRSAARLRPRSPSRSSRRSPRYANTANGRASNTSPS